MLKDTKQNKYCNCSVSSNKDILKSNINHSYCDKCGSILIKDTLDKIHYTLKSKQKTKKNEFNPIDIIRSMKSMTDNKYPYLNNEYNINDEDTILKENLLKSINIYLKHRKLILLTLQKFMKMFDYTDLIFYQCLFYMDIVLSHHMTEDISEKKILYYLIGYFLCSAKSKETDIYEPSLDLFCCPQKRIYLTVEKIAYYEVICLQSIKYNLFCYSAYDWINELCSIGIVFDCEINKNNMIILINGHRHSIINTINKAALKMLLTVTVKNIFIKYSPMYIALSLIQLSREQYLDRSIIRPDLFNNLINLFGINFNDHKKCYEDLKEEIQNKSNKNKESSRKEENQYVKEKINIINLKTVNLDNNKNQNDKEEPVAHKLKGSTALPFLDLKIDNEKKEDNKNNGNSEENNDIIDKNIQLREEDNIIFYDENNEDKNNIFDIDSNFIIKENKKMENMKDGESNIKSNSSQNINRIKIKNKNKLYINCNTNTYNSSSDLPKINTKLDQSLDKFIKNKSVKKENNIHTLNHFSFRDSSKKYLKAKHKELKPIETKKTSNSTNNKRYYGSNINNNSNNNLFKPKEELVSMRKSLFCDNLNNNINNKNNDDPVVIKRGIKKMNSEIPGEIIKLKQLINIGNNDDSFEEPKEINNNYDKNDYINIEREEKSSVKKNRTKSKSKNKINLIGKETKAYVPNKRNLSTNIKKRTYKSNFNLEKKQKS